MLSVCATSLTGCNTTSSKTAKSYAAKPTSAGVTYPARPTTVAPPFKVSHTEPASITLVTAPDATDDQIVAIIYQLRDAARAHGFDALHIPQKLVDARKPLVGFHIYRGAKCAPEKYASGQPPCGGSYHAAGDYTLGTYGNPLWDDGELLHNSNDESHQTPLWDSNAPAHP